MESTNPLFSFANYSTQPNSDLTFAQMYGATKKSQDDFAFGVEDEEEEVVDGRETWSVFEKARVDMINSGQTVVFETNTVPVSMSSASSISSTQSKPRKSWMSNFFHKNPFNKSVVAGKQQ